MKELLGIVAAGPLRLGKATTLSVALAALLGAVPALPAQTKVATGEGTTAASTAVAGATVAGDAPAGTTANAPTGATVSTGELSAKTVKAADPDAALQRQIRALPPLTGTSIDVPKRSAEILSHLNAILRFYRISVTPVQKVGEPSDVLYEEQSSAQALKVAELAFEAAKNEAALLSKIPGGGGAKSATAPQPESSQTTQAESQRLAAVAAAAQARLTALEQQKAALQAQQQTARGAQRATLQQQESQLEGGIGLQQAMVQALGRISSFSQAQTSTGLAGDIERLQRSAPELLSAGTKPPTPGLLQSIAAVHEAGVTSQATVLFQLLSTLRTIDEQTTSIDALSKGAEDLRTPFIKVLRTTVQQGQALTGQAVDLKATPTTDAQDLANTRQQFANLTTTFSVLADATLPLSQELVLLDNARGTLTTWRAAVSTEEKSVLRDLLIRVIFIAIALGIIALLSSVVNRLTVRYVSDLRRRRQLLFVRRAVVGFLSGLVILFGFVTQFSSLATFAGFISAGIAVGLQSILLSIAAYFFIVGRYGVRVGDRITVTGVTGDVIEVGLVRFYMMELVGTGTELHSTGRVAVFANSVLFQTGTPLYKQMPGTEYAWHELTAKLKPTADVPAVSAAILATVNDAYKDYSERIEGQHREVENWMGTALPAPEVQSRLQLVDGGLQFAVLFPVELKNAAATDQTVAQELLKAMSADGPLKAGLTELPVIKAAVKS